MLYQLKHRLHKFRHGERYRLLDALLETQMLPKDQLLQKREQDLAGLVRHAAAYSPYYKREYQAVALPSTSGLRITDLPVLRKQDVIDHRDEMLVTTANRDLLRVGSTGGSTGKPVSFYFDQEKMDLMRAGMCRSYMWSGWRPGQKILNFWGAKRDLKGGGLNKRVDDFLAAEKTIGAYEYTASDLAAWVAAIQRYRPVLLQGYASILAELAQYVLDQRLRLPATIKGVYSTAEMLYDGQRALMESAFSCKVFNQYGSREIPNIACECRAGNQHVFTDMVYLESVSEAGEDRLLVTSLTNRVMPFIRYDIGDSGRLKDGECACGSPFPMMEMGVCRSNDLIRTRNGKVVYPSYFIHLLDDFAGIQQYRFVQTALDRMRLDIVSSKPIAVEQKKHLQTRITQEVDCSIVLDIRQLDRIERTQAGKHRFVVSELV